MNGKIYKYFNRKKYEETGEKSYYIGQTIQTIKERAGKDGSKYISNSGNSKFSRAINKWGWDAFECEILEEDIQTQEELNKLEIEYIAKYDSYNNGYNSTIGGEGSTGSVVSEEIRKKISDHMDNIKVKVYCNELNKSFNSIKEAAEYVGLKSSASITGYFSGKFKSAGCAMINGKRTKLTWSYLNENNYDDIEDQNNNNNNNNNVQIVKTFSQRKVYCNELDMAFDDLRSASDFVGLKSICNISAACLDNNLSAGRAKINGVDVKLTWKYIDINSPVLKNKNNIEITTNKKDNTQKVYCPELDMTFESVTDAAKYINIKESKNIKAVCENKRQSAGKATINNQKVKLTWKNVANNYKENNKKINFQINKATCQKKVYCPELDMTFESVTDAANYIKLNSTSNISKCCTGKRSTAGSYIINGVKTKLTWKYIDLD